LAADEGRNSRFRCRGGCFVTTGTFVCQEPPAEGSYAAGKLLHIPKILIFKGRKSDSGGRGCYCVLSVHECKIS